MEISKQTYDDARSTNHSPLGNLTDEGSMIANRIPAYLLFYVSGLFLSGIPSGENALAQETFPQAQTEDLGFQLPQGDPLPANDRRALVEENNEIVVAKVLVEVGGYFVVLLPDGRITSVKTNVVSLTDRPFVPAGKEQMIAELQERFPGFKTRSTRRYVYVYNTSETFYKGTSRILETMYPALFAFIKRQKIPVHDPAMPLVVVMFKTQEEFQRYRRMPEGVAAYYNGVSNRVLMYEQSQLGEILPELAIKQSISTIAHEGVHQVLHNIGVQQRLSRWPMWISEGLPEYFAPTEVGRRVRWKGVGLTNDLRMYTLHRHVQERDNSPQALTVGQTVSAEQLDALGYAKSWALVHFLSKAHRQEFYDYLRAVSQLGPLERTLPGELFVRHFGTNYAKLEEEMFRHLSNVSYVDPIANQTHYVVMIERRSRRSIVVTPSPKAVRKSMAKANGGRVFVKPFGSKAEAERFAQKWLHR